MNEQEQLLRYKELLDQKYQEQLAEIDRRLQHEPVYAETKAMQRMKNIEIREQQKSFENPLSTDITKYDVGRNYDFSAKPKGMNRLKYWWYKRQYPTQLLVVHLELINGNRITRLCREDSGGFIYKSGGVNKFYMFTNAKHWNISNRFYEIFFHERLTFPVDVTINGSIEKVFIGVPVAQKIPADKILEAIEQSNIIKVSYASNPTSLHKWLRSNVIDKLLNADSLERLFKLVITILIIVGILNLIHFILFLKTSGMFDNIVK